MLTSLSLQIPSAWHAHADRIPLNETSAVRSFGTEGRVEGMVIPPSQVLHDFVCFRGQDIMDLHVHDAETEEVSNGVVAGDCL